MKKNQALFRIIVRYKHIHIDAEELAAREHKQSTGKARRIFDSFAHFKYI